VYLGSVRHVPPEAVADHLVCSRFRAQRLNTCSVNCFGDCTQACSLTFVSSGVVERHHQQLRLVRPCFTMRPTVLCSCHATAGASWGLKGEILLLVHN
jgi:hypothetical protein